MSPLTLVAAAVVIAASSAFVIIGNIYRWDLTSVGYAKWTRVAGVIAVLALAGVAAWGRLDEPMLAIAVGVGGITIAVAYVIMHRRLTDRVREQLSERDAVR